MIIGIDFDNTLALYENLFKKVAREEGIINNHVEISGKTELRDYLHMQPQGEKRWMKLQGLVYGKHMREAMLMPGAANFLLTCKSRKIDIVIVSHKTEYGHFDEQKVPLRVEALKWMESYGFFNYEGYNIKKENVYFCKTRDLKISKISSLKCDWFVDDLPELFEEEKFPKNIKKVLIGRDSYESNLDLTICRSWSEIFRVIFGEIIESDILEWTKDIVPETNYTVSKVRGRGNSNIFSVKVSGIPKYALKCYPDKVTDNRNRLNIEYSALGYLRRNNIKNVPEPFYKSSLLNIILIEWIEGERISKPSLEDIGQVTSFIKNLVSLSRKTVHENFQLASEACLSLDELNIQIINRVSKLKKRLTGNDNLAKFFSDYFDTSYKKVIKKCSRSWPKESLMKRLKRNKQILSPSDFGFHNCIRQNDRGIKFIDFDYFGWDDPVKLTADFILHPGMKLHPELQNKWMETSSSIFKSDTNFNKRLKAALPLYSLRWALIVLNEFLPEVADKRKYVSGPKNFNLEKIKKNQLTKATHYCKFASEAIKEL